MKNSPQSSAGHKEKYEMKMIGFRETRKKAAEDKILKNIFFFFLYIKLILDEFGMIVCLVVRQCPECVVSRNTFIFFFICFSFFEVSSE